MSEMFNDDAKRLIEEAFADVDLDVDGTPCPKGDDCSIHHRVDERTFVDEEEYGRIITYVGDYVVITDDNPEFGDPMVLAKLMAVAITGQDPDTANLPPMYETSVLYVGDGAIGDLRKLSVQEQGDSVRFIEQHNSWKNFENAHTMVVQGVQGGEIDLSKPAELPGE